MIGYLKNDAPAREVVKTIAEAGGKAAAVQADLSRPAEVTRLFDEAERAVGALDIVVANAADEDYDLIFDTNVKGVFFTLKEAARRPNGGRIIVTSTGGAKTFFPEQSLYLGSKGAVEQFVRTLSWELGGRGITVNAISPGPTETDMMQDRYRDKAAAMSPFNRIGDPGDIADVAVCLTKVLALFASVSLIMWDGHGCGARRCISRAIGAAIHKRIRPAASRAQTLGAKLTAR